jgi:hypothetical protein
MYLCRLYKRDGSAGLKLASIFCALLKKGFLGNSVQVHLMEVKM